MFHLSYYKKKEFARVLKEIVRKRQKTTPTKKILKKSWVYDQGSIMKNEAVPVFRYSGLSNKRDGWNKHDGRKILQNFVPKIHSPPTNFQFKCVFGIF